MENGNGIINFTNLYLRGIQSNDLTIILASHMMEGKKHTNEKKKNIHLYLSDTEIPLCNAVSGFSSSGAQDDLAIYCGCAGRSVSHRLCYQSAMPCEKLAGVSF